MNPLRLTCSKRYPSVHRQRGVVLFIALIAMVTIMLIAVALIRSVDTATVISGNLAFKQAATISADGGVESAVTWMAATDTANAGKDPFQDTTHDFNNDNAAAGYYTSMDPQQVNLTSAATWVNGKSADAGTDASGNSIRYIIQRMCRYVDPANPNNPVNHVHYVLSEANCLFSDAATDNGSHNTGQAFPRISGKNPLNRVTVRVTGPRNTVSYTQAFIY